MTKKNFKSAATAGTSAIQQIITGSVQNTQGAQGVKNTEDTEHVSKVKYEQENGARLNLKLPAELKEYLQEAAYRESTAKHIVSVTEYLCRIIRADMEKNQKG